LVTEKIFRKETKNIVDYISNLPHTTLKRATQKPTLNYIKVLKSFFGDTNPDLEHFIQLPIGYVLGDEPSHDGGYDYFLDFGTHLGEGMEKIRGLEHFKDDIEIHGFEANPHVFQKIEFQPNVNYYNIAVTESNGFFQVNYELDNDGGATMIDLNNWNPAEVYQWKKDERFQKIRAQPNPLLIYFEYS